MLKFPFDVWGRISPTPKSGAIEMIKVIRSPGGGYLMLTVESGSEFDRWVETIEEVEADLDSLRVEWPSDGDGPTRYEPVYMTSKRNTFSP